MRYLFAIILLLCTHCLLAQINTKSEWDSNAKEYKILAESKYVEHRVVRLTFDYLRGRCRDGNKGFVKTVGPGRKTLTTVSAIKGMSDSAPDFRYKTTSFPGRTDKKPDYDYPYLIPVKHGKRSHIDKQSYIGEKYGGYDPPKNWYSLSIKTNSGDTIYAARQGVVYDVNDNMESGIEKDLHYSKNRNSLSVQHKDGTSANYQMFQNGGIFVANGDFVYAGDPIGIIGGDNYRYGSHLSFSVYYYDYYPKIKDGMETEEHFGYAYVPIDFHSVDGVLSFEHCNTEVESVHEDDIICYEMSKKQRKKWNKRHSR